MKKLYAFVVGCLLFLPVHAVFAVGPYTASGFDFNGDTSMNGTFTDSGSLENGQPYYTNGSWFLFWYGTPQGYCIHTALIVTGNPNFSYWCTENSGSVDPVFTGYHWEGNYAGTHVDGDVAGATPPPPVEATSTVEQVQTNMAYGFFLFFLVAFGIIGYFQRRFMN